MRGSACNELAGMQEEDLVGAAFVISLNLAVSLSLYLFVRGAEAVQKYRGRTQWVYDAPRRKRVIYVRCPVCAIDIAITSKQARNYLNANCSKCGALLRNTISQHPVIRRKHEATLRQALLREQAQEFNKALNETEKEPHGLPEIRHPGEVWLLVEPPSENGEERGTGWAEEDTQIRVGTRS